MTPAYYKIKEVAEILNIHPGTANALAKSGRIPATRAFGRWLIPIKAFHAQLKRDGVDVAALETAVTEKYAQAGAA